MSTGTDGTVSSLHGLDAATLHEADGQRGALPSEIKPIDPGFRVCAPAFTVDCPAGDNLWIHHAVYAAQPGDVLVVHTRGEREAGYWGEILSRAALAQQLAGLVIDGGVRDVERLAEIGLPVFAANVCLRGTAKDPAPAVASARRSPIGETPVRPGDIVVGDRDGVVVIRRRSGASASPPPRSDASIMNRSSQPALTAAKAP